MKFYAKITKEKYGFLVEFPRLAGCLTEGKTLESALKNAKEALHGWLAARVDRDFKIPHQGKFGKGSSYPVEVDIQISFAIRLRELRRKRGLTQSQIARKLGITQQAYAKLEAPLRTNPSLSTVRRLSDVLDVPIDIQMSV